MDIIYNPSPFVRVVIETGCGGGGGGWVDVVLLSPVALMIPSHESRLSPKRNAGERLFFFSPFFAHEAATACRAGSVGKALRDVEWILMPMSHMLKTIHWIMAWMHGTVFKLKQKKCSRVEFGLKEEVVPFHKLGGSRAALTF